MIQDIIQLLFVLADRQGLQLAIDAEDGKVYTVEEENTNMARLHPIHEPGQTIIIYEPERLVTIRNKPALNRYCNEFASILYRDAIDRESALQRSAIGNESEINRISIGRESDDNRTTIGDESELIGPGKVNLQKFSASCPAEVVDVSEQIEQLLRRAIGATNKPATLERLIKIHKAAASASKEANIFKLNQIKKEVEGIVAKQRGIKRSEQTLARRARRRSMLFKVLFAVLSISVTVFYLYIYTARQLASSAPLSTPAAESPTPPTALAAAFSEWEQETGRHLYSGGRECIQRAAIDAGIIDNKDEIKKLIYANTK